MSDAARDQAAAVGASLLDGTTRALILDLDGVITDTASVHLGAWKELFDGELRSRAASSGEEFVPFEESDYLRYVDGKPRYDGVRSFLASRGIELPEGTPEDPPEAETVCGLGNRKNELFRSVLAERGADVFPGTLRVVDAARAAGVRTGCVSSSKNCRYVLDSVGLLDRFDDILDGNDAAERGLPGKPAPDTYLDCARRLGVPPGEAAMVEDALSGVQSGAAGGFRHVVGVDRGAGHGELRAAGATIVVDDLGELLPEGSPAAGAAGDGSAGAGPAGDGPAGAGPAGDGPAGAGPAGDGPAGAGPAGDGSGSGDA